MTQVQQFKYRIFLPRPRAVVRPTGGAWFWWFLISLVGTVTVANALTEELGLRFCQPCTTHHALKIVTFQREYRNPGIVFIGNSQVFYGIVPSVVERAAAEHGMEIGPGFNLGMPGAGLDVNAIIVRDAVVGQHSAEVMVVGVSPRVLAGERPEKLNHVCRFGSLRDVAEHTWDGDISPADAVPRAFRGLACLLQYPMYEFVDPEEEYYHRGYVRSSRGCRWLPEQAGQYWRISADEWWQTVRRNGPPRSHVFSDDAASARTLLQFGNLATRRGQKLLLVYPPQHPDYLAALYEPGTVERYDRWVRDYCLRHGMKYVDLSEPDRYDLDLDFADPGHLNPRGAEKFSRRIAEVLAGR